MWKRILALLVVIAMLAVTAGCIDPDEALPHYRVHQSEVPR